MTLSPWIARARLGRTVRPVAVFALALAAALPAAARDQASLGDLQISGSRVPQWHALDHLPLDTSGWTQVEVPCNGGDESTLLNAVAEASPETVLILPANCRYVFGRTLYINKSQLVIRGTSRETSILEFVDTNQNMVEIQVQTFPRNEPFGGARAWTGGYTLGTDVLTVANTTAMP